MSRTAASKPPVRLQGQGFSAILGAAGGEAGGFQTGLERMPERLVIFDDQYFHGDRLGGSE
jgi:hypothetical protein